jgi:hypothetical protein
VEQQNVSPARWAILGNPGNRRVQDFQYGLHLRRHPPAVVLDYEQTLQDPSQPIAKLRQETFLRIDSPGENAVVEQMLVLKGGGTPVPGYEHGEIGSLSAWYRGYTEFLRELDGALRQRPTVIALNRPSDIALFFDKSACHQFLREAGLPVPKTHGTIRSYAELMKLVQKPGCRRLFLKPLHGSSASGVLAYETNGVAQRVQTSVEMVTSPQGIRLFNSKKVRTYEQAHDIAHLVNTLGPDGLHVETWVPKAGLGGRTFDLRVLLVGGKIWHTVVRCSRGPLTNLHLGNLRGDLEEVRARMGSAWRDLEQTCERVAELFPGNLQIALDVLVLAGFKRHFIAEVNAFGDLLKRTTVNGQDAYQAQIAAIENGWRPRVPAEAAC